MTDTPTSAKAARVTDEQVQTIFRKNCVHYAGNFEVTPGGALSIARKLRELEASIASDAEPVAKCTDDIWPDGNCSCSVCRPAAPLPAKDAVGEADMVLVPREFIEFVKDAPVSSGVCCCGGNMDHSPYEGHSPVDQWDYSLSQWLEQIAASSPPKDAQPDEARIETCEALVRSARDVLNRLEMYAPDVGVDEFHDALRDAHSLIARIDGAE